MLIAQICMAESVPPEEKLRALSSSFFESGQYAKAQYVLGLTLLSDPAEALMRFERAREDPALKDLANMAIARVHYENHAYDKALAAYESVTRFTPLWEASLLERSDVYLAMQQDGDALGVLEAFKHPYFAKGFSPEVGINRAVAYFRNCQWDRATTALEGLNTLNADLLRIDIGMRQNLGVERQNVPPVKFEDSRDFWWSDRKEIFADELGYAHVAIRSACGDHADNTASTEQRLDEVVRLIQNTTPKVDEAKKPELAFRLADVKLEQARLRYERAFAESETLKMEALHTLEDIVDHYPKYNKVDEVLYSLAQLDIELVRKSDAARHLNRLLEETPSSLLYADAAMLLGDIHFEANHLQLAQQYFERALERAKEQGHEATYIYALYKLAWCDFNDGNYDEALRKFQEVAPMKREALVDMVNIYAVLGQVSEARDYFARIADAETVQILLGKLAETFQKHEKRELQVATIEQMRALTAQELPMQTQVLLAEALWKLFGQSPEKYAKQAMAQFAVIVKRWPEQAFAPMAAALMLKYASDHKDWKSMGDLTAQFKSTPTLLRDAKLAAMVKSVDEERLFQEAMALHQNAQSKEAFLEAGKLFEQLGDSPKALYNATLCYASAQEDNGVVRAGEAFLRVDADRERGRLVMRDLARAYDHLERREMAAGMCEKIKVGGHCAFLSLESEWQAYQAMAISGSASKLRKAIAMKQKRMVELEKRYLRVLDDDDGEWGIAALYRAALVQLNFVESLRKVADPPGLDSEGLLTFRSEIETIVLPVQEDAITALQKALVKAKEMHIQTRYTGQIAGELDKYVQGSAKDG